MLKPNIEPGYKSFLKRRQASFVSDKAQKKISIITRQMNKAV